MKLLEKVSHAWSVQGIATKKIEGPDGDVDQNEMFSVVVEAKTIDLAIAAVKSAIPGSTVTGTTMMSEIHIKA